MSASDDLQRALAARELDVSDLVRRAEAEARDEVAEQLRRIFVDDLLRRVSRHLEPKSAVALAGVGDGVTPLVLELEAGDLDDETRLEGRVRAHNQLLLEALNAGAVVPFRFGTTFEDRAALDAWVDAHRAELALELERLRGAAEWSVEVAQSLPEVEADAYLETRLATAVRPDVRTRLAAVSEAAAGNAYLVAREKQEAFAAVVTELEHEGYELRLTGPWPPYSFARLP